MDDEMSFHCVQQFADEVFEVINGDEYMHADVSETGETDLESARLMTETRKLARAQGVRLRFVSHRS